MTATWGEAMSGPSGSNLTRILPGKFPAGGSQGGQPITRRYVSWGNNALLLHTHSLRVNA